VSAAFGWFYFYNAEVQMTTAKDGVEVAFYHVVDDEDEPFASIGDKGLTVNFSNGAPKEDYKIVLKNTDVSPKVISLSFGNMTEYLFGDTLLNSYFGNEKEFVAYKFKGYNDDEQSGDSTASLALEKILNYKVDGEEKYYGQTARLLYAVQNLIATCDGEVVGEISDGFNLYKVSDGQTAIAFTLPAGSSAEITFSLYYTANMSDYENYEEEVGSNADYIDIVMEKMNCTELEAKAYLAAVAQKETELLMSSEPLSFLFSPQIDVAQTPREELS
jgi:hypothetical protein